MVRSANYFQNQSVNKYLILVFSILMTLSIGCSSDSEEEEEENTIGLEGTNLSIADIAGSWIADEAEIYEIGNPNNRVDIVGEGGSVSLTILNNGRFTSLISPAQLSGLEIQGQMGFDGNRLVIIEDGFDIEDAGYYSISLDAQDRLHLNGDLEFPMGANGNFVPTNIDMRLIRQ